MEHVTVVNDTPLPDARVEREIMTLINMGFKVSYIGPFKYTTLIKDHFIENIIRISWSREARLKIEPYYSWLKRRVSRILRRLKPDIILAENIFAGMIVHELGYPMVLDDHEIYSLETKSYYLPSLNPIKYFITKYKICLFKSVEKTIAEKHPVIVVTENSKNYYINVHGASHSNVFVIKNYPSIVEIRNIKFNKLSNQKIRFVYIGSSVGLYLKIPHKDLSLTFKVLDELYRVYKNRKKFEVIFIGKSINNERAYIKTTGYLKHSEMFKFTSQAHYGLASWKPSWFHKYCNPNKPYIYAHSAALPVITETLDSIIKDMRGYSIIVKSREFLTNLKNTIISLLDLDEDTMNKQRLRLFEYSRKNLLWEKQSSKLVNSIKRAT